MDGRVFPLDRRGYRRKLKALYELMGRFETVEEKEGSGMKSAFPREKRLGNDSRRRPTLRSKKGAPGNLRKKGGGGSHSAKCKETIKIVRNPTSTLQKRTRGRTGRWSQVKGGWLQGGRRVNVGKRVGGAMKEESGNSAERL